MTPIIFSPSQMPVGLWDRQWYSSSFIAFCFAVTHGLASSLAVWGQACKTHLNKILILQKKVLRMIYFVDTREHAIPLFIDADILPVSFMYYKSIASIMHDINNNISPQNILNLF